MRRPLLVLAALAAVGLLGWRSRGESPIPAAPEGCKPEAPIAVALVAPDGAARGAVRASFDLRPVLELAELQWSWQSTTGVSVIGGAPAGTAGAARGQVTREEFTLLVPDDGLYHRIDLLATGILRPHPASDPADGPETVTVQRSLTWGEPDQPTPIVISRDAETGALVPVAAVPTTHVPAPPDAATPSRGGGR